MIKSSMKKTLLAGCAIALLAGCAPKTEYEDKKKEEPTTTTVGSNAGQMIGEEKSVTTPLNGDLRSLTHEGVHNVESEIDGNVVVLESVHFAFDKFNLNDEMREVATTNYNKINKTQTVYSGLKVKLEGNCDEWGTDEYNYALGLKRAKTTKDALVADGMNPNSIIMVSYGESNPVCTQKNTTCWKMNRRVDYRLLP